MGWDRRLPEMPSLFGNGSWDLLTDDRIITAGKLVGRTRSPAVLQWVAYNSSATVLVLDDGGQRGSSAPEWEKSF